MVPIIGTIIAMLVCTAEDYKAVKIVAKRALSFYNNVNGIV
jgi:hypothetical protein